METLTIGSPVQSGSDGVVQLLAPLDHGVGQPASGPVGELFARPPGHVLEQLDEDRHRSPRESTLHRHLRAILFILTIERDPSRA
jgi:hypothetical protein